MGETFREIIRHISLYKFIVKNCLIKQMEYRTNFFMMAGIEFAFFIVKLLYALVVYKTGIEIYGLSPDAVVLFIGTFTIMSGIYTSLFYFNFSSIQQYINEGTLDMLITKPVSLQFMVTLRNFDIGSSIPNVFGGLIMVVIGWKNTGIDVNFMNIAGFIGFMVSGTVVGYCLMLLPQLLCFWIVKASSLRDITNSIWDFNNMPMNIYNNWIKRIGTFIFPIFLITNFSPLFVLGRLNSIYIVWGILAPFVLVAVIRLIWKISLKRYASASS